MHKVFVRNCNERVKDEDTVIHVGDYCFKNSPGGKKGEGQIHKATYYQKDFKGNWIYIKGNHDSNNSLKTPIEHITIKYGGKRIKLVHNPIHADSSYEINLCGHVHNAWKIRQLGKDSILYNVGVDVNNFRPITFEEIMREIAKYNRNKKEKKCIHINQ